MLQEEKLIKLPKPEIIERKELLLEEDDKSRGGEQKDQNPRVEVGPLDIKMPELTPEDIRKDIDEMNSILVNNVKPTEEDIKSLERDITMLEKNIENLPVDNENKDILEAKKNDLLNKVNMRFGKLPNKSDNEIKKPKETSNADNMTADLINDAANKEANAHFDDFSEIENENLPTTVPTEEGIPLSQESINKAKEDLQNKLAEKLKNNANRALMNLRSDDPNVTIL